MSNQNYQYLRFKACLYTQLNIFLLFRMMKLLIKYLSLCILLLGGFSQLPACPYKESTLHSLVRNLKVPEDTSLGAAQNNEVFFIKPISFGTEKQNDRTNESLFEFEEDDELVSFKRHLKSSYCSFSIFFAQTLGHFFIYRKKIFSFYTYLSCRYIIFQAFRI